jgi:biopolymer transport protein ExbD
MALHLPSASSSFTKDPNVVPMIDILLVLLIIFMMQVPLSRKAMDAQVPPEQKSSETPQGPSNNIVVELKADGTIEINGQPVIREQLDLKFHEIYDTRPQKILFVKSAPNRKYSEIIETMDIARGAGVQVIGFTPPDRSSEQ